MKNSLIHCSTSMPHMAWGTCLIAAQFLQQLLHHSAWLHLPQLPNPPSSSLITLGSRIPGMGILTRRGVKI